MKLAYVMLAAASLFLGFMVLEYLPAGFRELLLVCWVGVAIYCMFLFAKPESSKRITSYDRQKDYRKQLLRVTGNGQKSKSRK